MTAEATSIQPGTGQSGGGEAHPRRWLAMIVLILAFTLDLLNVTVINVALPAIQRDLGADPIQLEWISAAYLLAFAAALITAARLGDLWGRKRIFLAGLVAFALTGLWSGLAGSPTELIAARAAQGLAAAALTPPVMSIMYTLFQGRERATVFGMVGFVASIAQAGGMLLGGVLITTDVAGLGWRSVFLVLVPIAALLVAAGAWLVPESRVAGATRPRWPAAGILTAGLVAIVFPLLEGRRYGWPAWCWACLAAGILVVAGLGVVEHRRRAWQAGALLPAALFRIRTIPAALGVQLLAFAGFSGFMLVLALWLQDGQHYSPLAAGVVSIPFCIGALVMTPFTGRLTMRFGRLAVLAGCLVSVAGALGLVGAAVAATGTVNAWTLVPGLVVLGVGINLVMPPLATLFLSAAPPEHAGSASGMLSTVQQFSAAVGVATIGTVFFARLESGSYLTAFATSMLTVAAALVAGAVLCFTLAPRSKQA
jgi:MFS family permease